MKAPLIVSTLALLLSAAALVTMLRSSGTLEPREQKAVAPGGVPDDAELLAEVEALRERVLELELEQPAAPSQRAPVSDGYVTLEDFAAFRDEVNEALEGSALVSSIKVPEFKEHLVDTLHAVRQEEVAEAVDAKLQGRLDSLDERMLKMQDHLGLTSQQSTAMRSALTMQYERNADLTRRWRAGEDTEVLGEVKRSDYQAHQDELAGILTPDQIELYRSSRGGGK